MDDAAPLLVTPRLRLRRFVIEDADSLFALDSDPLVMRYISGGIPTPRDRIVEDILPRWIAAYRSQSCIGYWAAEREHDGEFAGWFHLRPDRFVPEDMELGYRLRRRYWSAGLATEGSIALLDRAFRRERIETVSARTLVGNVASRRVMEKSGLRCTGEFEYPESMLPGWPAAERRAVRYFAARVDWLRRHDRHGEAPA
jgi:RimJ/RimL family protein N-acetyltransferase